MFRIALLFFFFLSQSIQTSQSTTSLYDTSQDVMFSGSISITGSASLEGQIVCQGTISLDRNMILFGSITAQSQDNGTIIFIGKYQRYGSSIVWDGILSVFGENVNVIFRPVVLDHFIQPHSHVIFLKATIIESNIHISINGQFDPLINCPIRASESLETSSAPAVRCPKKSPLSQTNVTFTGFIALSGDLVAGSNFTLSGQTSMANLLELQGAMTLGDVQGTLMIRAILQESSGHSVSITGVIGIFLEDGSGLMASIALTGTLSSHGVLDVEANDVLLVGFLKTESTPSGALASFHETVEISATLAPYPIPCGNNHHNSNQCCDELTTNGPTSFSPLEIWDLYPFGSENGDLELFGDDSITDSIKVPSQPFNFFGSPITSFFVTTNGYISIDWRNIFGGPPYGCDGTTSFVAKIIAPFWADHDLSLTGSGAYVYYRTTTDLTVTQKAKEDIGRAFPKKFCDLDIKWALVATWYNATFYGYNCPAECDGNIDCAPRNTFQAVIATDGIRVFAIFYYQNITWASDAGDFSCIYYPTCTFVPFQCGDVCTGLGGRWANVGFDNGDGTNYYWHPSMCGPEIVDIDLGTNIGVTGVYVYRIDQRTVIPADPHC